MDTDCTEQFLRSLNTFVCNRNGRTHLKNLLFRGDERLKFVCYRFFTKGSIDESVYKSELHRLIEREITIICDDVFFDCDFEAGKQASNKEREARGLTGRSLNYGEIEYKAFCDILASLERYDIKTENAVFYDLGSGTGKALVCARLFADFRKVKGVELLASLSAKADKAIGTFNKKYLEDLWYPGAIEHEEKSLLDADWSDGDVVFCNSTAFDRELMEHMSNKAAACLKKGAIVITFTKPLHDYGDRKKFEELERVRMRMSWGPATVIFFRKR